MFENHKESNTNNYWRKVEIGHGPWHAPLLRSTSGPQRGGEEGARAQFQRMDGKSDFASGKVRGPSEKILQSLYCAFARANLGPLFAARNVASESLSPGARVTCKGESRFSDSRMVALSRSRSVHSAGFRLFGHDQPTTTCNVNANNGGRETPDNARDWRSTLAWVTRRLQSRARQLAHRLSAGLVLPDTLILQCLETAGPQIPAFVPPCMPAPIGG